MSNNFEFEGKVVLVTGSSSGIGEGTALKFVGLGAKVVITGRNEQKVNGVANKCRQLSQSDENILEVVADLNQKEDIERLIHKTISKFNRLDVLVNNAGVVRNTNIESDGVEEKFDELMNIKAISLAFRAFGLGLDKQKTPQITPEEVAEAIVFLASDRASLISGTTLQVDGGSMATLKSGLSINWGLFSESKLSLV